MATDDDGSNDEMKPEDAVTEGKLVLPPDTSARQVKKPRKAYPPLPVGKKLIFRWSRINPRTGQVEHAHNRPFPMLVDDDGTS